jgi:predicted permease
MSTFLHDLRFASRLLLKRPVFTVVAVVTLALGIGLNTAVFSAIEALMLRPLPGVRNPDELVQLYRTYPGGFDLGSNSIPHFRDVKERSRDVFTDVAAWSFEAMSVSLGGKSQRVMGVMASANYFALMGVVAARGRVFVQDEETGPGAHPVAVVSHKAWNGIFGGDPEIVGRKIILNGNPYTVVGVTPPEFKGSMPMVTPEVWVPLMQISHLRPESVNPLEARGNNFMNAIARLAPGATVERARQRMQTIVATLKSELPDHYTDSGINVILQSDAGIHPSFKSAQVGLSSVVMAVVVMLLLIACVNVANLFLARAQDRWREMAVRVSIGARRSILVRQLLTESLLFAIVAGLAGLAVAWIAIALANRVRLPVDIDFSPDLQLSPSVLLFTLGVTIVTAMLFGLAPALQATRPSLVPALKGEAPAGGSRSRMSRGLVVVQMALSLMLLICAGLFLRNLESATAVDKGFNGENLLLASVDPPLQGYERARTEEFYRRLVERLQAIPGVRAVGLAEDVPLGLSNSDNGVSVPGYTPQPNENMSVSYNTVSPGYFETMGIPIKKGRPILARDDSAAARVVVVNELFATRFFRGQEAVGRTVKVGSAEWTIVGVVPTGKYRRLGEDPLPYMYYPQAQRWNGDMTIHIRTSADPSAAIPALRAEVVALDPDMPLSDVRTMGRHLGIALLPARLAGTVLAVFGLLGLVLAAVGIYGVMAYSVAQRTREIGIRMAIGAARGEVVGLVMRQGLLLVGIGAVVGLAGALGASQLIRGVLYGNAALDPISFVVVPFVLVGVAVLAIWIPARRAAGIDPVHALRSE